MSARFADRSAPSNTQLDASDSERYHDAERQSPYVEPDSRPEKTTATASRMIAAGLDVETSKRSEEQINYDRAV